MIACLAPLLETNLRALVADIIGATDASETEGGDCLATLAGAAAAAVNDLCEDHGGNLFLNARYFCSETEIYRCSIHGLLASAFVCREPHRYSFRTSEHIKTLECRALHRLVERLVRNGRGLSESLFRSTRAWSKARFANSGRRRGV